MDSLLKKKSKGKILVADDDPINVALLNELLKKDGFEVVKACNGRDAIDKVLDSKPDLVILDILMPELNGYEVCKLIKKSEDTKFIPVIIVTSLKNKEDKIIGLKAGADDFLIKPFDKDELFARVNSLVKMKGLYDKLEKSYRDLKEAEASKKSLTEMIIHDLKNPIMAIMLSLESIPLKLMSKDDNINEKIIDETRIGLYACDELMRLILNILDTRKIESSSLPLRYQRYSLNKLIESKINMFSPWSERCSIDIILNYNKEIDYNLNCDINIIGRVIENLLSNALKYTYPNGWIIVDIKIEDNDVAEYIVSISNKGDIISKEHIDKIFDKYEQGDLKKGRLNYGTGLGLTFCKMAVELHKGRIWVKSNNEEKTTFSFAVPIM